MLLPDRFAYKIEKKNIPFNASFELTWKCNLRCVHCYQNPPCNEELTETEVKDILDQLAQAGCLFLTFTGGEPLVRRDFFEIARYANRKKFALYLKTNGTLMTSSIAQSLRRLNFLEVHFSLYGATAKTHDSITQKAGSFQKTIDGVKYLKEEGIKTQLMVTLMRQNIAELMQMKTLSERLKADLFYSPLIYARHDKGKDPLKFRLTDKDVKALYWKDRFKEKKLLEDTDRPSLTCQFGRTACTINPLGEVYPCVGAPIPAGNLREHSFKEIWQTSHLLREIRSITDKDLKECSTCESARYCFRCSGAAYLEKGDIMSPYPEACRLAEIKKEVVG